MQAVGFYNSLPINHPDSFIDITCTKPNPQAHQLLVKIRAIAVNPVDYKVRQNSAINANLTDAKIIGWDACGIVESVGESVSLFKVGDEVFYAGDISKPGCYAQYQLVNERIVGHKPKNLSDTESAAMPLTSLTAWEMLFDRMRLSAELDKGKQLLIIGAAGGVGSIAIQLAKKLIGLEVSATASRPETAAWCKEMGADQVINHHQLLEELAGKQFDYIIDLANLNTYWEAIVQLIKPQGHICSITGSETPIALQKLKTKSATFSWEYMYTRPLFATTDMARQHEILNQVSQLLDNGTLKSTLQQTLQGLSAKQLKTAHQQLESGTTIGKTAILL